MFRKYPGVILMLISVLFLSLAFQSREGFQGFDEYSSVSVVYNANKTLHNTIIADTKALRRSLNEYRKSIVPRQPRPEIQSIDAIIAPLRKLYTRSRVANISTIDQYKSLFLDIKTSMTQIIANNYMPDFTTRAQGINVKIDNLVKIVDKQILSDKTLKAINDIGAAAEKSTCAIDLAEDIQYFIKDCYNLANELNKKFVIMKPVEVEHVEVEPVEVEHVFYMYDGIITENCRNNDCRLGDTLLIKYSAAFLPLFVTCPGTILVDTEYISYSFSLTQADVDNKTAVYTKYVGDLDNFVAFISSIKMAIEASKNRLFVDGDNSYADYVKYTQTLIGKIEDLKLKLSGKLIYPIKASSV